MPRIKTFQLYSTQSLYAIKLIIEAGSSPNPLSCVPLSDKASFHQVHSSYLVTPSNHHLAAHYQQPCPLITIHPSTEGEWGQSCFNFDQHTKAINLKMFQLRAGVPSCQGDFTLDMWAAKWVVCWGGLAFPEQRDTNFHEGGTRPPKPVPNSGQSWKQKGTDAEAEKRTIDTVVFFSRRGSQMCLPEKSGGVGAVRRVWGTEQRKNRHKGALCQRCSSATEDNEHYNNM